MSSARWPDPLVIEWAEYAVEQRQRGYTVAEVADELRAIRTTA
jgi:hypothetical protein